MFCKKIENLEAWINKVGFDIVNGISKITDKGKKTKYRNEIDKALGVLVSDGVYAYYVYVKSKGIEDIFIDKLKEITMFIEGKKEELNQDFFEKLSQDINKLLFFREILEKILIYARYHAKAMEDNNE